MNERIERIIREAAHRFGISERQTEAVREYFSDRPVSAENAQIIARSPFTRGAVRHVREMLNVEGD